MRMGCGKWWWCLAEDAAAARKGHGPVSGVDEGQDHGPAGTDAEGQGHGIAEAVASSAASSQLHFQLQGRHVDDVPWASYSVKNRQGSGVKNR